jgi:hypothetical protein
VQLIHLIYVSRAVAEMPASDLDKILASSVRHNKPQGVTGLLLYSKGSYMQVLEGDDAAVSETFGRIERDPRHTDIFVLDRAPISERHFEHWHMGYKRLGEEDGEAFPEYAPFFENGFNPAAIGAHPGLALDMLLDFGRQQTSTSAAAGLGFG